MDRDEILSLMEFYLETTIPNNKFNQFLFLLSDDRFVPSFLLWKCKNLQQVMHLHEYCFHDTRKTLAVLHHALLHVGCGDIVEPIRRKVINRNYAIISSTNEPIRVQTEDVLYTPIQSEQSDLLDALKLTEHNQFKISHKQLELLNEINKLSTKQMEIKKQELISSLVGDCLYRNSMSIYQLLLCKKQQDKQGFDGRENKHYSCRIADAEPMSGLSPLDYYKYSIPLVDVKNRLSNIKKYVSASFYFLPNNQTETNLLCGKKIIESQQNLKHLFGPQSFLHQGKEDDLIFFLESIINYANNNIFDSDVCFIFCLHVNCTLNDCMILAQKMCNIIGGHHVKYLHFINHYPIEQITLLEQAEGKNIQEFNVGRNFEKYIKKELNITDSSNIVAMTPVSSSSSCHSLDKCLVSITSCNCLRALCSSFFDNYRVGDILDVENKTLKPRDYVEMIKNLCHRDCLLLMTSGCDS